MHHRLCTETQLADESADCCCRHLLYQRERGNDRYSIETDDQKSAMSESAKSLATVRTRYEVDMH